MIEKKRHYYLFIYLFIYLLFTLQIEYFLLIFSDADLGYVVIHFRDNEHRSGKLPILKGSRAMLPQENSMMCACFCHIIKLQKCYQVG